MGSIKVHAGDFKKSLNDSQLGSFNGGNFRLYTEKHSFLGEKISGKELEVVEIANEESVKKVGGAIGFGILGGALLGPVGLLAGLLAGGQKKEVTFIAKFKDGRKLLATTDSKTFIEIQAAIF